jgi:hypothetical protein
MRIHIFFWNVHRARILTEGNVGQSSKSIQAAMWRVHLVARHSKDTKTDNGSQYDILNGPSFSFSVMQFVRLTGVANGITSPIPYLWEET